VVKLEPGGDAEQMAAGHGLRLVGPLLESRHVFLMELISVPEKDVEKRVKESVKALEKDDGVVYAEQYFGGPFQDGSRFHGWPDGDWTPAGDDPRAWTDQPAFDYLQLDRVHPTTSGRGVTVAILDTGVDFSHPNLSGHLSPAGYDYVDDDAQAADSADGVDGDRDGRADEAFGHGTHAAGVGALIAPEAEIVVYRVLDAEGNGDPFLVAEAINDAVAGGADVINMSFGVNGRLKSKVFQAALKNAVRHDVVIVAAAGNVGSDYKSSPAGEKDVVGVGATTASNNELADFSNYGKWTLVAAPGVDIVSTVPGGDFGRWSGTSMSTSIVTGQVALLRAYHPDRDRHKIIEVMGRASIKLNGRNKVNRGLLDLLRALDRP
jgi:thermitase